MFPRSTITLPAAVLFVALLAASCGNPSDQALKPNTNSGVGTNANKTSTPTPTPVLCGPPTSAKIEADVKAWILGNLTGQKPHINFEAKGCVLVLYGWTDNAADYVTLTKALSSIPDVSSLDLNNFYASSTNPIARPVNGVCDEQHTLCGQMCIPKNDRCNISAETVEPDKTRTPTPTPTPK